MIDAVQLTQCQTCPREQFAILIKEYIKPFFKERHFKKRGLTFYRETNGLYYLVNFQKSQGNRHDCIKFYVNLGIYSSDINKAVDRFDPPNPRVTDYHYRVRIEQLTDKDYQDYRLDTNTNAENIAVLLLDDLTVAIETLLSIQTVDELIDTGHIDYRLLSRYLLMTRQKERFQEYYNALFQRIGKEENWSIIKNNLDDIVNELENQAKA